MNNPSMAPWSLGFLALLFVLKSAGLMTVGALEHPIQEIRLNTSGLQTTSTASLPVAVQIPDRLKHEVWQNQAGNLMISLAQVQRNSASEKVVPYLPPAVDLSRWYPKTDTVDGIRIWSRILGGGRVAISRKYLVGPFHTDTYRSAKLLQIPAIYMGQTRFGLITIEAVCSRPDCSRAVALIQSRWEDLGF